MGRRVRSTPKGQVGRTRWAVAAVLGLTTALVSAATAAPAAADLPPPSITAEVPVSDRSVFVIGDSVLRGAAGQIHNGLRADGWSPTVATLPGLPLAVGARVIAENRPRIGEVVVIHLGNNLPDSVADYRRQVDDTMATLHDVHAVIWLTIQTFTARRAEVNAVLHEAATRYPNMVIIDWAGAVARNPGYASRTDPHLSVAGRNAMTSLIRGELTSIRRRGARCAESTSPGRLDADPAAWMWLLDSAGAVHGPSVPATGGALGGRPVALAAAPGGYRLVDGAGKVEAHGPAWLGDAAPSPSPVVDIQSSASGAGYRILRADGSVDAFGDAVGARGPQDPPVPAVAMVGTDDPVRVVDLAGGYAAEGRVGPLFTVDGVAADTGAWLLGPDGAVHAVGGAPFLGSAGTWGFCVAQRAGGLAVTPSGRGYWVVTDAGVVAAFGDAPERDPVALTPGASVIDIATGA